MGVDPPFLYDPPSKYSLGGPTDKGFNPKAVSHASWSQRPERPKQDGPLINAKEFNRHPDSYMIVPYGNLNSKPMSPRTRQKVKYTRLFQLFLRISTLLGSMGMLFCVIAIRGTDGTLGWIIRAAPGAAILHTLYATYHLARGSKERPPASTASYMLFAAFLDICLIPFFVLAALMARTQYTEPAEAAGRWTTLFNDDLVTFKITCATFLISTTIGGLLVTSLLISIYLAVIFRKIAQLPPDMNPLEDNLTSRHKRNKSSMSTAPTEITSTRNSHLSDPLIDPPRTVPFLSTRNDSSTSLSSPERRSAYSNRSSNANLPAHIYQQPQSQRSSGADLDRAPTIPVMMPLQNRSSMVTDPRPSSARPRSSRPSSTRPQSAHAPSLTGSDSNWITYPSTSPPPQSSQPRARGNGTNTPAEFRHLRASPLKPPRHFDFTPSNNENINFRPLEMNPPTPPNASQIPSQQRRSVNEARALTPATGNTAAGTPDSNYAYTPKPTPKNGGRPGNKTRDSFGLAGNKARYYGDLIGSTTGLPPATAYETEKEQDRNGRVVSSGADTNDHGFGFGGNSIMRSRRDVSGKIAEEGRGLMGMRMGSQAGTGYEDVDISGAGVGEYRNASWRNNSRARPRSGMPF